MSLGGKAHSKTDCRINGIGSFSVLHQLCQLPGGKNNAGRKERIHPHIIVGEYKGKGGCSNKGGKLSGLLIIKKPAQPVGTVNTSYCKQQRREFVREGRHSKYFITYCH